MFELRKVALDVTNACNLRCKHCYTSSGFPLENELSFDEIKNLLTELYDLGVFELELTGGEPFMRPDFIKILRIANSMDFLIEIVTNGTLLDEEKVRVLQDLSIRIIQIPIEGLKVAHEFMRGKGTFDLALKAVKMLKDAGLNVQVRMTATKKSLADVEALAELLASLEVDKFLITEFIPVGRGLGMTELMLGVEEKEGFQKILTGIRKKYEPKLTIRGDAYGYFEGIDELEDFGKSERSVLCGALRGDWCEIMSNGVVTPCDLIQFYAGNVRLQKISEIWNNSPVFKVFRDFDPKKLKGACDNCHYKVICGGCRALAFLFYGDFYEEDPMCWRAHKKVLR